MIERIMYTGTVEYLDITVTADTTLDTQPVAVSFDNSTWHTATWTGAAGTTRSAQLLLGTTVPLPAPGRHPIYVRVTDNPEVPIALAGHLWVKP